MGTERYRMVKHQLIQSHIQMIRKIQLKPGTDKPIVPHYPGTEPKVPKDPTKPFDPDINPLVPLTPVDPKDPSKGYEVPPSTNRTRKKY